VRLSHNHLVELPEWVGNLKALRVLRLDHTGLARDPHPRAHARGLAPASALLSKTSNFSPFSKITGIRALPFGLADCASLEMLDLDGLALLAPPAQVPLRPARAPRPRAPPPLPPVLTGHASSLLPY